MSNGEGDTWIRRLWERDVLVKTLKLISIITAIVVGVGGFVGGFIVMPYKNKLEMEAKFAAIEMAEQKRHEQVLLKLVDVNNKIDWTEASVEVLAEKVPLAIQMHELSMHPKKFHSDASPTKIVIDLPDKPEAEEESP